MQIGCRHFRRELSESILLVDLEHRRPLNPSSATTGVKEIQTTESPRGSSRHQVSRVCYVSSESKTSKTKSHVPGISWVRQARVLPDYVRTLEDPLPLRQVIFLHRDDNIRVWLLTNSG